MFNLIKSWYDKLFPKPQPKFELSIRGEYFYDYCVEIVKGNNPYIAAYEEKLTYFCVDAAFGYLYFVRMFVVFY